MIFIIVIAGILFVTMFTMFLLINKLYKESAAYQNEFLWVNNFRKGIPNNIKLANFGSTYSRYAFDAVDEMHLDSFDFALRSQSLVMDKRILKRCISRCAKGCIVIFQMNPCVLMCDEHFNEEAIQYRMIFADELRPIEKLKETLNAKYPLLRNPKKIKKLFYDDSLKFSIYDGTQELLDEKNIQVRMESTAKVWVELFHLNNLKDTDFSDQILRKIEENVSVLEEMIEICQENNVIPVLVSSPFSKYLNEHFSSEFVDYVMNKRIEELSKRNNIPYIHLMDAPEFQNSPELYIDGGFCLNRQGSMRFINILAQRLESQGITINNDTVGNNKRN